MRHLKPIMVYKCPKTGRYIQSSDSCKSCSWFVEAKWNEGQWTIFCDYPYEQVYVCQICGREFDTKTGKGKMHMAGHGYNLKYAVEKGLAVRKVLKKKVE